MSDRMSWPEALSILQAEPGVKISADHWIQPGKFLWMLPAGTVTAPDGAVYPTLPTLYFKDAAGNAYPYTVTPNGHQCNDWYVLKH
jgi:hypothetical protein